MKKLEEQGECGYVRCIVFGTYSTNPVLASRMDRIRTNRSTFAQNASFASFCLTEGGIRRQLSTALLPSCQLSDILFDDSKECLDESERGK